MANILDFLRAVLTDADSQSAYRADPAGYVVWAGFGELTREDVTEGIKALQPSLGEPASSALAGFGDEAGPGSEPNEGESELGAAIRVLSLAVGRASLGGDDADIPEAGDEPDPTAPPPTESSSRPSRSAPPPPPPPRPAVPPRAQPSAPAADAPPAAAASTGARPPSRPVAPSRPAPPSSSRGGVPRSPTAARPSLPPRPRRATLASLPEPIVARMNAAIEEAVRETRSQLVEIVDTVSRMAADAGAAAEARLKEVVRTTEEELARLRDETIADRDAARHYRDESSREADALLESARRQTDEARMRADELLATSRAEHDAVQAELTSRRAELREAERQLRERLTGIDSVFRTVLRDDPKP